MNTKYLLGAAVLVLSGWLAPGAANACQVWLDTSGVIRGEQSFVDSFTVKTAGILTVTLTDLGPPVTSKDLYGWVTSANGEESPTFGPGTESFQVGPGLVSMHWVGDPTGKHRIIKYDLELKFHPGGSVVPLPTSLALLASGLALLFLWRRGHRAPAHAY
jgi:hypothetical protein